MRAYFVQGRDCDYGVAIIAETAKSARNLAIGHDALLDVDFIDIEVRWKRGTDVTGLPRGEVECLEGLRRGLYGWIMGECPNCRKDAEQIECAKGAYSCESCRSDAKEVTP